ncbi:hemolysin family protein [Streptomyces sp. ACA25]|uniref:hemolysin family protein n=1 Tax=Streptomyces sp. ACA25 TaxID=3022596 RepID=UPI0023077DA5|nr:hemolysin family protein [Streptomyces sp. ACA25]MDB1086160.1 hemolysin family protein [Streptomyces sp. ACA25]
MSAALGLLAVLVLIAGNGYFVAQEFAYVAADRLALAREAEAGDKRAARAVRVQKRLSFMLSGAQLGITVTSLVVGFLAEPVIAQLLSPVLSTAGVPDAAVRGLALTIAFVLATAFQMVFGELAPKNLALAVPERLAKSLALSTLLYLKVAGPVIRVFDSAANKLLHGLGIEPAQELLHGATAEDLGHLIVESHQHGQLPQHTADLLDHALEFSERTLGEVMVPRVDVAHVRAGRPASGVIDLISRNGHSHHLVIGDRVDDIIGVIGVRELMRLPADRLDHVTAGTLARRALLLPDTLPLPRAVEQMQAGREEFAVVIDEYGGLGGIVTLEDIAEELVGEIADESDRVVELAVADSTGGWSVDAGRRVDEVSEAIGIRLPEDASFETVAGLVVDRLGRFPVVGDRLDLELPDGGWAVIEVLALDRHVPDRVRVERVSAASREEQPS